MSVGMMWVLGIGVLLVATFEPTLFFWGVIAVLVWQAAVKVYKGESFRGSRDLRVPYTPPRRDH